MNFSDKTFGPAAAALTFDLQQHRTSLFIAKSGERISVKLIEYLKGPDLQPWKKREILRVLTHLDRWTQAKGHLTGLANLSESDIEEFLGAFSSQSMAAGMRRSLRYLFSLLHNVRAIDATPVRPPFINGPNYKLPALFTLLGPEVVHSIIEHIEQRRRSRLEMPIPTPYVPDMTVIHRMARWANEQGIYDLRDFSIGDGRLYLGTFGNRNSQKWHAAALRPVFEILIGSSVLNSNPFPFVKEDGATREATISPILNMAQASGDQARRFVRAFLFKKDGAIDERKTAALNHFMVWLNFEEIRSFDSVTTETLLRYRTLGLADFTASSRRTYFACVTRLFREIHGEGYIRHNPSPVFYKNAIDIYTPLSAHSDLTDYLAATTLRAARSRRVVKIDYVQNFAELDILALPFRDRLFLARWISMIEKTVAKGAVASNISFYAPNSDGNWGKLEQMGAITISANREARCSSAFIRRYMCKERLPTWANEFVARFDANVKLFQSQTKPSQPSERPRPA